MAKTTPLCEPPDGTEAGEIVQAIGKVLRHGWDSCHPKGGETNRETLERELGDLRAVQDLRVRKGDLRINNIGVAALTKPEAMKWYTYHQTFSRNREDDDSG